MSRIGKQPVPLPQNVEATIDGSHIFVKGPKGELDMNVHDAIEVKKEDDMLIVKPKHDNDSSALWGLTRALIFNMVMGVTEGYSKRLEIDGVGYKAQMQGKNLVMNLGFSHPIEFAIPENISVNVEGNTIDVSGIDKGLVGQISAKIRAFKKPEPYKGKGIHYKGEHIRRKVGKKAATA